MDDSPDTSPRDLGSDLEEITRHLGEPEAIYQTNRTRAWWRLTLGSLLVIISLVCHVLFWTGMIPWPAAGQINLWSHLIMVGIAVPMGGMALVSFALGSLRMWVLVYPTGLFVWHRGAVVAFPWEEIDRLYFQGLPAGATFRQRADTQGMPSEAWYDLSKGGGQLMGTTLSVVRRDGVVVKITSVLTGFAELGERIQRETMRQLFPDARARLRQGELLDFNEFKLSRHGLLSGGKFLRTREIDRIDRSKADLRVFSKGKKKPFTTIELLALPNPHLFMAMVEALVNGPLGNAESVSELAGPENHD